MAVPSPTSERWLHGDVHDRWRPMNPIFFGSADRQLFGVYHAPARARGRKGVVLCYPWGQEYLRAHRAFRFLGESLAGAGVHVLRFDYWGTGDSGGDVSEADLPTWASDVELTVHELMDIADLRRVALCGLRMGAHWAARCAVEHPAVDRVVLWDPVVDGVSYVRSLDQTPVSREGLHEVDGFTLTAAVRDGLASASADDFTRLDMPSMVLSTSEHAATDDLVSNMRALDLPVTFRMVPASPAWKEENGDFGTSGMPVSALQEITQWLSET